MDPNYNFRKIFTAACLGMLLFGIVIISLGSILPAILEKYGFDALQAGSLASILPAGILLGSLGFGPLVDRYSYRNLMMVCTLLIIAGLEGIAIAPGLFVLQVCFFLIGVGGGALNGGTNALVADISESMPGKRSANLSLLGVFFGIGALGVPALMAALSSIWTYDRILTYTGIAIFIPLIYFITVKFPPPKQPQGVPLRAGFSMLRDEKLIMLGLFLFFQSALEGIINNWTTTFLESARHITIQNALVALSLFVASLTGARMVLAVVLRSMPPYRVLMTSIFILVAGAGWLLLGQSPFFYLGSFILLGIGVAAGFPVILGYVSDLYKELRGTAFSLVFFIALLGNILINYIMGLLAYEFGISLYPWILFLCTACLLVITMTKIAGIAKTSNS